MAEQSQQPHGGLSPNFNLADSLNRDSAGIDEFELPKAVEAAQHLFNELYTDSKTGLLRQESFMTNLSDAAASCEKTNSILQVFVADLDGFKTINDTLGHPAGDELLGIAAQAFKNSFQRRTEVLTLAHGSRDNPENTGLARLGGDEFAAYVMSEPLAPDKEKRDFESTVSVQAERVNHEFQKLLQDTKFANFSLHISVGSATYQPGNTSEELFARADHDMFKVKYAGKVDSLTLEDRKQLQRILPFLEGIGTRIEPWLKEAVLVA